MLMSNVAAYTREILVLSRSSDMSKLEGELRIAFSDSGGVIPITEKMLQSRLERARSNDFDGMIIDIDSFPDFQSVLRALRNVKAMSKQCQKHYQS